MKIIVDETIELEEDGTLIIHVKEGERVKRVLVIGDDHMGDIFYPDKD